MRKWNAVLSILILAAFSVHGILGAGLLAGVSDLVVKQVARGLFTLVMIHAMISIWLTGESVKVWRKTGAPYWKENEGFWIRRISGLAILILACFHMTAFGRTVNGVFQLYEFGMGKFLMQLLLVCSILIHGVSNGKALFIACGSMAWKKRAKEFLLVLTGLSFLMAAGLVVYFVRWNL